MWKDTDVRKCLSRTIFPTALPNRKQESARNMLTAIRPAEVTLAKAVPRQHAYKPTSFLQLGLCPLQKQQQQHKSVNCI